MRSSNEQEGAALAAPFGSLAYYLVEDRVSALDGLIPLAFCHAVLDGPDRELRWRSYGRIDTAAGLERRWQAEAANAAVGLG